MATSVYVCISNETGCINGVFDTPQTACGRLRRRYESFKDVNSVYIVLLPLENGAFRISVIYYVEDLNFTSTVRIHKYHLCKRNYFVGGG